MKLKEVKKIRRKAARFLAKARIAVTPAERNNMEVADFGLKDHKKIGLEVVIYESNDRYCAKELVLFPRQTCPEHRHPPVADKHPGKQETFRCRWGEVYLYVPGEPTPRPRAKIPKKYKAFFTVWKEIRLRPGGQYTLPPNTLHWFQAGTKGAVVSEFSSSNTDEYDLWTDPKVRRIPKIE
jgi:D-lyxose ketol-isomerase